MEFSELIGSYLESCLYKAESSPESKATTACLILSVCFAVDPFPCENEEIGF